MNERFRCFENVVFAVTVTDEAGTIVGMNTAACQTFAADGGDALVGRNVLDCHPEPARTRLARMLAEGSSNHYTISKRGQRKVIHQVPYYENGAFAGLIELSIPIPDEMPHFEDRCRRRLERPSFPFELCPTRGRTPHLYASRDRQPAAENERHPSAARPLRGGGGGGGRDPPPRRGRGPAPSAGRRAAGAGRERAGERALRAGDAGRTTAAGGRGRWAGSPTVCPVGVPSPPG
jgi:PAS domain-containing protein